MPRLEVAGWAGAVRGAAPSIREPTAPFYRKTNEDTTAF